MAEKDEIAQLREDLTQQQAGSQTLLGIVKGIDTKVDELTGAVRALQVNGTIVDARLNAMDARISAVDARVGALSQDMANSFRQVESTMASKQDLTDLAQRMDERMLSLDTKLDQVITLLTRQAE